MSTLRKPLRVIVCGTGFGRVYLRGIEKLKNDEFQLVGILSRGSEQSKKWASKYNIPLYTSVDEIKKNSVDIACVVVKSTIVGGKGTNLAKDLLSKGINVIQEHPVHYEDLIRCLKIAHENNCFYEINSFYPNTRIVRNFINTTQQLLKKTKPVHIEASCSVHVLFAMIDILGQAFSGLRPWSFLKEDSNFSFSGPFNILNGEIKGIPITLSVQNEISPQNPDNFTYLLHRIVLTTTSGNLIMTDTHGSLLWNLRMHIPHNNEGIIDLYGSNSALNLPVSELICSVENNSFKYIYDELWPEGIKNCLQRFGQKILLYKNDSKLSQYQLLLCKVWNDIGERLGNYKVISEKNVTQLTLDMIRK